MAQSENRAIRPADIIELIRAKGDGNFQARNFRDGSTDEDFQAKPFSGRATVVEPTESPDTKQPVPPPPAPGIPEDEVEHRVNAARAAAKAEGIAEERARLEDSLQDATDQMIAARDAFTSFVEKLGSIDIADTEMLKGALEEAIRHLASERAGSKIDDIPEHFLARLDAIVDRVSQGIQAVKIRLNAEDFAAIEPHIGDSELIEKDVISIDVSLGRGDIIVRTDAVRLQDIIAPQKETKSVSSRKTRSKS